MKAIEIKKDIHWIGALDPDLRIFDIVMYTPFGTTYNSYVVKGETKTAVFETVKEKCFDEYVERLTSLSVDISKIDYIVVNHTEPDHAGSVAKLLQISKNAKVVGSSNAIRFLKAIVNHDFEYIEVKDGDSLDLGGKTLKFISAPFLHWPDSIYTYLEEDKILFSCDSFGAHYCLDEVFNDKIVNKEDYLSALKYYFDGIMGPFKAYVLKVYDKIKDVPIDIICPGHGPILRENPKEVIELYKTWSSEKEIDETKISIFYVSAYGYTKELAEQIAKGIKSISNYNVSLYDVIYNKQEELVNEINTSKAVLFGSPTINGDALKPIWDLISFMNPLIHSKKPVAAFGSYGWSGEAVPSMEKRFTALRLNTLVPGLKVNLKPSTEELEEGFKFGVQFAEKLKTL